MTTARYLIGDVFDRMAELEDGSVDLIMTSPPFLALRSYLPVDHPDKAKEIGSEATPAEFLDTMLRLTAEWGRLLAPHGSICVELGDTYSGSGGGGGDYYDGGLRAGQPGFTGGSASPSIDEIREANARHGRQKRAQRDGWPLDKSLCGIPTLYTWSLAYGRNLLTGETSPAGKWRIRNLVAWVRPNPPVGALGDKFRPATSYLTIATRARDRYFDLDAVRTPADEAHKRPSVNKREEVPGRSDQVVAPLGPDGQRIISHPAGAPPLDWWEIPPGGYPGSHYAVYPPELCIKPIEAMCPRKVCTTCGQPSERITGEAEYVRSNGKRRPAVKWKSGIADGKGAHSNKSGEGATRDAPTLGWTTCGCPGTDGLRLDGFHTGAGWRPGHVLDPFAGSGTTLAVAVGHGRAATGIDIDERNADLARERIGMFLTVDHPSTEVAS